MRKNKILKNLMVFGIMFSMIFSMVSITSFSAVATTTGDGSGVTEETSDGTETSSTNQMLHFIMEARWGNVIGDLIDVSEVNFDGSIDVTDSARVSLERTLLFEKHNSAVDKVISRTDPVSWSSLIYGHWDGVKVLVSSPADDNVTITTSEGTVTMTAQELYDLSEQYVENIGETGREIVIKTYPIKKPQYFLKIIWGKTGRAEYALKGEADEIESQAVMAGNTVMEIIKNRFGKDITVYDASGDFKINSGGTLGFIKTLRFEGLDKITSNSSGKIGWTSHVAQGVDGMLVKLKLDSDSLDNSDTVTLNFTEADWSKDFNIADLYHNKITAATVSGEYGVVLQVWRKVNRSLIRVKNKATVYMVNDGIKRPIPSPAVLHSQGLGFGNVLEVSQDEADTFGDGDAICYSDGSVVQEDDRPEVYIIADGEKKHIESPTAFTALGYDWNNIIKVQPGVLGLYRNRAALKSNSTHPEGALIREVGTQTVFLIEGGKKKPISSLEMFNARHLNWNNVLVVAKHQMNKFQLGENIKYPDGALLKDPDGKVYKIDQGEKLWIRTKDDFYGAGYEDKDIITVTDATEANDLALTAEGNDIYAYDE